MRNFEIFLWHIEMTCEHEKDVSDKLNNNDHNDREDWSSEPIWQCSQTTVHWNADPASASDIVTTDS